MRIERVIKKGGEKIMFKKYFVLTMSILKSQKGMAKVFNPLQSERASGKASGGIFQSWRGLNVFRKFTMPTIRNTVTQMKRRGNFSITSKNWKEILTQPERDSWNALKLTIHDLWAVSIRATGLDLYKKINEVLLDAGKTLLTLAPTTTSMAGPLCTIKNDATANEITVPKPSADEVTEYAPFFDVWVAGLSAFVETVANVTLITTVGVSPSINPGKNSFRHIAFVNENSTTDQTLRFRSAPAVDLPAGVKLSVYVIRYTKDGLKSVPVKMEGISVLHV